MPIYIRHFDYYITLIFIDFQETKIVSLFLRVTLGTNKSKYESDYIQHLHVFVIVSVLGKRQVRVNVTIVTPQEQP